MTIPVSSLFAPDSQAQWLAQILANAATLQLQTSSWQAGGMVRTILAVMANIYAQEDAVVSSMIQGGFLDYAATGTVTYTTADGTAITTPVTPDPSIPDQNPSGAPGWLDLLADSVYDVQRIGSLAASGTMAIANASGNTYGPYAAGQYHVANPTTGATYSNPTPLTITPGVYAGSGIQTTSSTSAVPITVTTTAPHGLSSGQVVLVAGVLGETAANGFWPVLVTSATQFTLVGSAGTGVGYTSGGTVLPCQTATFTADLPGTAGTSAAKAITQAVTSATGVSVSNTTNFFGSPFESNAALAARCRASIQALSPGGPSGAYAYFALSAYQLLLAQAPPVQLSAPITRVSVSTVASQGVVNVLVANATGAVPGVVQLPITGATNATPIVLTTSSAHGLSPGQYATVSGVLGNTAANGTWVLGAASGTSLTLLGSTGNGAYTSGGSVEGGDLGEVDTIIQANAVPDSVTAKTVSASAWAVAIVGTVVVPQAQVAAYTQAAQTALAVYFATLPIGGASGGALQYNDLVGVLFAAGSINGALSYVISIPTLTLNGTPGNIAFPGSTSVATETATLTVQGQ